MTLGEVQAHVTKKIQEIIIKSKFHNEHPLKTKHFGSHWTNIMHLRLKLFIEFKLFHYV